MRASAADHATTSSHIRPSALAEQATPLDFMRQLLMITSNRPYLNRSASLPTYTSDANQTLFLMLVG